MFIFVKKIFLFKNIFRIYKYWEGGEVSMMVWRSLYRVARDVGSNISRRALFFLTSLPPLTRTKARDERAVKMPSSYMQTVLHYDTEMCIFSWQFPGWIHPFDSCPTITRKYHNQCEFMTSLAFKIQSSIWTNDICFKRIYLSLPLICIQYNNLNTYTGKYIFSHFFQK